MNIIAECTIEFNFNCHCYSLIWNYIKPEFRGKGVLYKSIDNLNTLYSVDMPDIIYNIRNNELKICMPGIRNESDNAQNRITADIIKQVVHLLVESKLIKITTFSIIIKDFLYQYGYDKIDESIYNFDNIKNILI